MCHGVTNRASRGSSRSQTPPFDLSTLLLHHNFTFPPSQCASSRPQHRRLDAYILSTHPHTTFLYRHSLAAMAENQQPNDAQVSPPPSHPLPRRGRMCRSAAHHLRLEHIRHRHHEFIAY